MVLKEQRRVFSFVLSCVGHRSIVAGEALVGCLAADIVDEMYTEQSERREPKEYRDTK